MASDIDVNEEELHRFIEILSSFQDQIREKMTSVESAYARCGESWKGVSAAQFRKEFDDTKGTVNTAIEVGGEALDWLRRFHTIVREFESY